ncbi:MAG: ABC transporter ATP-binding protein [Pseudomonadota bacterium]
MNNPLLRLDGLTKGYPGVVANDDVSFDIRAGEIHALLGENGAGKSTLVKMIYGLVQPDTGTMTLNGGAFAPAAPRVARMSGVAMVFQHFSLFDALSVAENIALGMENPPKPAALAGRITDVSNAYGLPLDPGRLVGDLSAGERQRVEIIRCLLQDPKLLIMDEPTSVLTPQEVDTLFTTLRKLRDEGTAILYISHKLEEIRALCETATILRGGKKVATCDPREQTASQLAEMMVGTSVTPASGLDMPKGKVVLGVDGLSLPPQSAFGTRLQDIRFTLSEGEVLGIGGVAGNGQDELLSCLSGEVSTRATTIHFEGRDISALGPNPRRALGLLAAPEERLGHAAAPDMTLTENAVLTGATREGLAPKGIIGWGKAKGFAERVIQAFDVRTPGPGVTARSLSGGNLQKFVVGREILQNPKVFVVNQPTWGVDAAAAATIRQALVDLAAGGAGVIVISQDLDELMEISTGFAALNAGKLSATVPMRGLTLESMGMMLGGANVAA